MMTRPPVWNSSWPVFVILSVSIQVKCIMYRTESKRSLSWTPFSNIHLRNNLIRSGPFEHTPFSLYFRSSSRLSRLPHNTTTPRLDLSLSFFLNGWWRESTREVKVRHRGRTGQSVTSSVRGIYIRTVSRQPYTYPRIQMSEPSFWDVSWSETLPSKKVFPFVLGGGSHRIFDWDHLLVTKSLINDTFYTKILTVTKYLGTGWHRRTRTVVRHGVHYTESCNRVVVGLVGFRTSTFPQVTSVCVYSTVAVQRHF